MSNEYQCEILKETQPLKEYSQYNNDSSVVYGMMDTKDGSQGVYTVYADKDRTPQLNCLIEWKNDLTSIIQDKYPNIELEQTQADIDALQNKLNEYANKIEELYYRPTNILESRTVYKYNSNGNIIEENRYKPNGELEWKYLGNCWELL